MGVLYRVWWVTFLKELACNSVAWSWQNPEFYTWICRCVWLTVRAFQKRVYPSWS